MIAPRTADQYRAEARRLDVAALAAEDRGDLLGADRMRVRALNARRAAMTVEMLPARGEL